MSDSHALSSSLPTLTQDEKAFLAAVAKGNDAQVKKLLTTAKGAELVHTKSASVRSCPTSVPRPARQRQ